MSTVVLSLAELDSEFILPALSSMESEFTYPLGSHERFRICHGDDYSLFYRAMGKSVTFAAMCNNEVAGTISASIRQLRTPSGDCLPVVYVGDIKVKPSARETRAAYLLLRELGRWAASESSLAFGVVMDGTQVLPDIYTGRIGIEKFEPIRKVAIFQVPCRTSDSELRRRVTVRSLRRQDGDRVLESRPDDSGVLPQVLDSKGNSDCHTSDVAGRSVFVSLVGNRFAILPGDACLRSLITPRWLRSTNGGAIACLEDTRRAKKLIAGPNHELVNVHLSGFTYTATDDARELIRIALAMAAEAGFANLYFCSDESEQKQLELALAELSCQVASATIYGTAALATLCRGKPWLIHSSEI